MKKLIAVVAFCTVMMSAVPSRATIDISWAAGSGFYPNGAVNDSMGLLQDSPTGSVLVQLILTSTGVPGLALPGGLSDSPTDEIVRSYILGTGGLGTGTPPITLLAGGVYADFSAPNFSRAFVGGLSVFGRIFTSATPDVGDFYYDGPVEAVRDVPPLGTPQGYNLNINALDPGAFPFGGDIPALPVVPEPSSLLLLAVGALSVAACRRRVK